MLFYSISMSVRNTKEKMKNARLCIQYLINKGFVIFNKFSYFVRLIIHDFFVIRYFSMLSSLF